MASPSSASVLDAELLSTSSFQKPRYPGRPTRAPSVESLHLSTLSNSSSGVAIHPNVLRKRHSNYALSNSSLGSSPVGIDRTMSLPPLPDVPTMDPIRSPRNPSRPVSQMPPPPQRKKPRSRPSTADNNKERSEVTPWEFQSLKEEGEGENPPLHSKAESPSVRSRSSFTALGKPTGPVAVVTPWEVQSLEEEVVEIEKVYEPKTPSQATTIGTPVTTLTGPVEEVTPWELHPMPATQSQRTPSAFFNATGRMGRSSVSSLHLHSNRSSSNISHNPPSGQTYQTSSLSNPSTPLTNVFGNTSLPPNGGRPHSNSTSSAGSFTGSNHIQYANVTSQPPRTPSYPRSTYSSSFGYTGTGPVEDVTPWELHAGPDDSSPPILPGSATSSNFPPARRSTSRPPSAKGQGSVSPSRPSSAKGLYGGASFLTSIERAIHILPSGGILAASKSSSSQSLPSLGPGGLGKPNSYEAGTGGKVGATAGLSGSSSTGMFGVSEGTEVEPTTPILLSSAPPSSPGPSQAPLRSSESVVSHKAPSAGGRSLGSKQLHPQLQYSTRPPPTGPTEDVTPWELHPATLPLPDAGVSSRFLLKAPPQNSARVTGEAKRTRPKSMEIQRSPAAEKAANLEDDLDARIQAESNRVVSGTSKDDKPTQGRPRPSMTLDQLEEVVPWELYPPPPSPVVHALPDLPATTEAASESGVAAGKRRVPTETYGPGHKTLSDFGLRRRRSTGASGATSASSSGYSGAGGQSTTRRELRLKDREDKECGDRIRTSIPPPGLGGANIATPLATSPSSPLGGSTSNIPVSPPQLPSPPPSQLNSVSTTPQPPKFSTADRTILEQLKANLQAREAQFTLKGVGHTIVGGGRSPGKKHHPYSREVAPYPRSYGREVVDLDVWETMFALDICESLTWHVFETPPTKVLEIGCGTGTWILRCAETWKKCHFVGLDIVPLHPDLQNVGSESAPRITWMQHNFLEGLPFQNEEFDFVHIKRIALGVPENKWDKLFEEIERVMKPGGAFEMVEEDLFFPGKSADDGDDVFISTRYDDPSSMTRRPSITSEDRHDDINGHGDTRSETPTTFTHQTLVDTAGPPRSDSPVHAHVNGREHGGRNGLREEEEHRLLPKPSANSSQSPYQLMPAHATPSSTPAQAVPFITPHSRSAARPALSVKTQRNGDPYSSFIGFSGHPSMFGSSVSLLGSMGYIALNDPLSEMVKKVQHQQRERAASQTSSAGSKKTKASPFTLQNLTNSPTNPRDHRILKAIWNGMLESRFVNLTPLSILTTVLEYHFKDVRTHPPLLYTFPPMPIKSEGEEEEEGADVDQNLLPSDSETDTDDARDAVIPRPRRPRSTKSKKCSGSNSSALAPFSHENGELSENHRWLSMQALLRHQSPYVSLDESRTFGYSPSRMTALPVRVNKEGSKPSVRRKSRLPNTTLNIDLRTLNLHLALRAKEIIACSESMWEWVLEYQANALAQGDGRDRSGSIGSYMTVDSASTTSSLNLTRNVILEMTRDDFDLLLNNFEMDMQDKASVGNALQERFNWHVFTSPVLQDRKAFDNACEKYEDWAAAQNAKLPSSPHRHHSNAHRSRHSMPAPGLVPTSDSSASHDTSHILRAASSPQSHPSTSYHHDDTSSIAISEAPTLTKTHHSHDSGSTVHFAAAPSSPSHATHSMPTQMLSRAMRVFVAWKAL